MTLKARVDDSPYGGGSMGKGKAAAGSKGFTATTGGASGVAPAAAAVVWVEASGLCPGGAHSGPEGGRAYWVTKVKVKDVSLLRDSTAMQTVII